MPQLKESKYKNLEMGKNLDVLEVKKKKENQCVNGRIFALEGNESPSGYSVKVELRVANKRKQINLRNTSSSSNYYNLCDSTSDRRKRWEYKLTGNWKYLLNHWIWIIIRRKRTIKMKLRSLVLATALITLQKIKARTIGEYNSLQ